MLAVATFCSVRSANRSARVAELSLLAGSAAGADPLAGGRPARAGAFRRRQTLDVPGHGGGGRGRRRRVYLAIALRNGGSGLAVIHGWQAAAAASRPRSASTADRASASLEEFPPPAARSVHPRRRHRLLAGGAARSARSRVRPRCATRSRGGERVRIDLLYGDHEGGQRTIVRSVRRRGPTTTARGAGATCSATGTSTATIRASRTWPALKARSDLESSSPACSPPVRVAARVLVARRAAGRRERPGRRACAATPRRRRRSRRPARRCAAPGRRPRCSSSSASRSWSSCSVTPTVSPFCGVGQTGRRPAGG